MEQNFNKGLAFVLQHEGGYTNDPLDRGGETNFGIIQRELTTLRRTNPHLPASVKGLTKEQAGEIYHQKYWIPCGAPSLPTGLDIVVFDTAVNLGIEQALTCLKRTAGASDRAKCYNYLLDRMTVYGKIVNRHPTDQRFFNGWHNRVTDLKHLVNELLPPPKVA